MRLEAECLSKAAVWVLLPKVEYLPRLCCVRPRVPMCLENFSHLLARVFNCEIVPDSGGPILLKTCLTYVLATTQARAFFSSPPSPPVGVCVRSHQQPRQLPVGEEGVLGLPWRRPGGMEGIGREVAFSFSCSSKSEDCTQGAGGPSLAVALRQIFACDSHLSYWHRAL